MNCVLYTDDMEPITVLDLPMHAIELGKKLGDIQLAVLEPPRWVSVQEYAARSLAETRRHLVRIRFEKLMRRGCEHWILTTHDEVLALMLRPGWLPGQRGAVNGYERTIRALTECLVSAIERGGC